MLAFWLFVWASVCLRAHFVGVLRGFGTPFCEATLANFALRRWTWDELVRSFTAACISFLDSTRLPSVVMPCVSPPVNPAGMSVLRKSEEYTAASLPSIQFLLQLAMTISNSEHLTGSMAMRLKILTLVRLHLPLCHSILQFDVS